MTATTQSSQRRGARRAPSRGARHRRSPVVSAIGVIGELILTGGVLVLLYVAYVLWGTGIHAEIAQNELREQTLEAWGQTEDAVDDDGTAIEPPGPGGPTGETSSASGQIDIGDGYAFIRIPRFGENWEWVVVEGTNLADLSRGPGHYSETADPGELGNLSIAGHRSGYGEPFGNMHDLQAGDTIEIETADGTWVYTVNVGATVIDPTETWVIDPSPGQPGAAPTERRLTLTTCHPRYGSSERMYVSAILTDGPEV